jgi:PleD family two-component response regulator
MIEFKRPLPLQFNDKGFLEKHTSMQKQEPKRVLAVVSDLFFSVKLSEAAKRNGLALEFVKEGKLLLEKAHEKPSLIIFDLNFEDVHPLDLIAKLKESTVTKGISLIGYLSHVQVELKQKAQEAGCDMVLARSAFSQNMPQIFKRHSGIG